MTLCSGRCSRITPACAGSTAVRWSYSWLLWDHPRLRGEHIMESAVPSTISHGSPPPARGALGLRRPRHGARRITPACAGSTMVTAMYRRSGGGSPPPARGARWSQRCIAVAAVDHPRLRGEHWRRRRDSQPFSGSPPPARGARTRSRRRPTRLRITPACAGSTHSDRRNPDRVRDHPRLRGEHDELDGVRFYADGSPPPARGARPNHLAGTRIHRITPACAGSTM